MIFFQEIWMKEVFELPNYTAMLTPATVNPKGGKHSGGLSIFVLTALKAAIEKLELVGKWGLAVSFTNCKMLCTNFYLCPQSSHSHIKTFGKK